MKPASELFVAVVMATSALLGVAAADEPTTADFPPRTMNLASAIVSVDVWAGMRRARAYEPDVRLSAGNAGPKLFFGYLEFDQDPDAPGGVPGFGPLPGPADQPK